MSSDGRIRGRIPKSARTKETRTHPEFLSDAQAIGTHRLTAVKMREDGELRWMCNVCGQVWRQAETFEKRDCEEHPR